MKTRQTSSTYDVAPAHDADAVQTAPDADARASPPEISDAAVEEIARNASVAVRARELRGEEFDFDLAGSNIEVAPSKPKPKNGWLWLLVALAASYGIYTFGAVNGEKSRRPLPVGPFSAPSGKPMTVKVQVAGQVNKPGVYELPFNARVQDAIRQAGGPKAGADLGALNMAEWAQDGGKIEIPARAAPSPDPTPTVIIKEVPVYTGGAASAPSSDGAPSDAPSRSSGTTRAAAPKDVGGIPLAKTESGATSSNASVEYLTANPIDLNKATQSQLEVLPGVGPKMAERIIAYRTENGGFKSVDELDDVKGIGEKRMATLKPLVKVR